MRQKVLGAVGVMWGGTLLALHLARGARAGGIGAYAAGRGLALVFAGLLFAVGYSICCVLYGQSSSLLRNCQPRQFNDGGNAYLGVIVEHSTCETLTAEAYVTGPRETSHITVSLPFSCTEG